MDHRYFSEHHERLRDVSRDQLAAAAAMRADAQRMTDRAAEMMARALAARASIERQRAT